MAGNNHTRPYSKRRYIFAFIITLLIFSLGVMFGLVIEGKRVSLITAKSDQEKLDFASLQLQYQYMDYLKEQKNCDQALQSFQDNLEVLENTRIRLENYIRKSSINEEEFRKLKREYMIYQLNYWLFAKKTKEVCKRDEVSVLYIYSDEKTCPDCEKQAFVLTYFRKLFKDKFLVFSFDTNYEEEPMVGILKRVYGIEQYPAIIIEDKVYQGYTDAATILNEVCKLYEGEYPECSNAQAVVTEYQEFEKEQTVSEN